MKNYTRILSILALALLTIVMPATAQTDDNKNKAIVETADGTQQLNTDEISIIRFDGDKVIFVQPWGESVFDRTLRSLTFLRPLPGTLRLTVNAGINEHQTNRAQAIDGDGNLKTTWESGDVVYVYADESSTTSIGTLTPTTYGSNSATLTGDIDATGLADNQQLYFSTQPRSTYSLTTQDGTVESLFYCTASDNVTIDGGNATISGNLDFIRPFAVVKFSLKDKNKATDDEINADKLVVTVDGNSYTVTPASATDELFVGIPSFSDKTVYLTANEGSTVYTYDKAGVYFEDGKYYAINVKMSEYNALNAPLTFEAMADGFTVTLSSNLNPKPSLQYSIDGGVWTDFTFSENDATTPAVNTGHTISFRGDNSRFFYYDGGNPHASLFTCSGDCYLYGNIMSLLSASGYATATSVGESAFLALFDGNTKIYSHNTKELLLPATTLARSCYEGMFRSCKNLTTAPNLPAETLAEYCYSSMFNGCTELVNAPEISATTLAAHCCEDMFNGCTSLTTGPTLSATTLADYCYMYMFHNCSNLNSVTCLATTNIYAEGCTLYWLQDVADTGTFTAANNTVMWNEGSSGIPSGWTRVNQCNIVDLATLTGDYEAKNGDVLINTLADNYKISVADGATVTLRNAEIKGDYFGSGMEAGINCQGDATILFEGTNIVVGRSDWPGIYVPSGKTLTISGDGNLTATGNSGAAGIGGRNSEDCGNIIISEGTGTITAISNSYGAGIGSSYKGTCGTIEIASTFTGTVNATSNDGGGVGIGSGNKGTSSSITINGGTVKATGSVGGAGIGSGSDGSCGSITITDGVTSVTATKGSSAPNSIGKGSYASCGTVTIGGTVYYQDNAYVGDGETYLATSPLVYPAPV